MKSWMAAMGAALAVAAGSSALAASPAPLREAGTADAAPPGSLDPAELDVLLSSIGVTVSLIDVYGQCRDGGKSHEECMAAIRATLDHARHMIGK